MLWALTVQETVITYCLSGQMPTKPMAFTLLLSLIVIAQLLVLILGDKRVRVEAV